MKGFDDKCLILFPSKDILNAATDKYQAQFNLSLQHLMNYLKAVEIQPYAFYTDDCARECSIEHLGWIHTLNTLDRFFVSQNCIGCENIMRTPGLFDDELFLKLNKTAINNAMSIDEQFDIVTQHDKAMYKAITKTFKIVINFASSGKSRYSKSIKTGMGHILLDVNPNTFCIRAYMSDTEQDVISLLNKQDASRSLLNWEDTYAI